MSGEINWNNIEIIYYSMIPFVVLCVILVIFSFYRYREIKILVKEGKIINAIIISMASIKDSRLMYFGVTYECLGIKYDRSKRIEGDRVKGVFHTGDVVRIILNPQKPKYFIFKDLYTRY
ncbi:MAG: hypothetical protein CVV49_21605 [Spirochaetae bacterium HGW-Spirochaetae-5]|nr:MAG: hypothetical protein CVV49_21605 [Spirochaetae bacterium HGW-Spirochaetae-5]